MSNYVKPTPMDRKYQNMDSRDFNINYQRDLMLYEQTKSLENMNSNRNNHINYNYNYDITHRKTIDDYLDSIDTIMSLDNDTYNEKQIKLLQDELIKEKSKSKIYTKNQVEYAKLCLYEDKLKAKIDFLNNDIKTIILFIMSLIYIYVIAQLFHNFEMGLQLGVAVTTIWLILNKCINTYIKYLDNKYLDNIENKAKIRSHIKNKK